MSRRAAVAAVVALALLAAGCGDDGGTSPASSSTTEASSAPGRATGALAEVRLGTERVAQVDTPTAMAARAGTQDLYVAEQAGRVRRIQVTVAADGTRTERLLPAPVLDLTGIVKSGGEQGLLGLVFSSDGRALYVFFNRDPDGHTELQRFDLGDRATAGPDDGLVLRRFDKDFPNHNGGQLALGPDGFLYLGLGDGGGADDPDGHGQDLDQYLGKILRIDPDGDASGHYAIPPDNPYADGGGKPEIWASGLRNPWRFSFDRSTGDLWIADVGQGEWEELDRLPATSGRGAGRGANLGWDQMEGSHPHDGGSNPKGAVLPIFEYDHGDGSCAVVGGYVYRGAALPTLAGAYLFTDYCRPGIRAITVAGDHVAEERTFDLPVEQVQSFGEDADGEVYLLLAAGDVLRLVEEGA